jgi:hypothetical protein
MTTVYMILGIVNRWFFIWLRTINWGDLQRFVFVLFGFFTMELTRVQEELNDFPLKFPLSPNLTLSPAFAQKLGMIEFKVSKKLRSICDSNGHV